MGIGPRVFRAGLAGLVLLLAGCAGNPAGADVERLREENRELRARVEELREENRQLRGQPISPDEVYAHFANDASEGTLGGLLPGDYLVQARARYGQENRARSWTSDGEVIFEYEWDLAGGLVLRVDTGRDQRITRIAVVLDGSRDVNLPTLLGLHIGQETYETLQKRFPDSLSTALQLWGAEGYYTVAQTLPISDIRQMEFVYEVPEGLSQPELDRIERAVRLEQDYEVLATHLKDRVPYLVALERTP